MCVGEMPGCDLCFGSIDEAARGWIVQVEDHRLGLEMLLHRDWRPGSGSRTAVPVARPSTPTMRSRDFVASSVMLSCLLSVYNRARRRTCRAAGGRFDQFLHLIRCETKDAVDVGGGGVGKPAVATLHAPVSTLVFAQGHRAAKGHARQRMMSSSARDRSRRVMACPRRGSERFRSLLCCWRRCPCRLSRCTVRGLW